MSQRSSFSKPHHSRRVLVVFAMIAMLFYYEYKKPSSYKGANLAMLRDRVTKYVAPNNFTTLISQNTAAPKVVVQIAVPIGSAHEEPGKRGLAHFLEHLIFKGTQKLKEGDIDAVARKFGATFNAFTSKDETSYYFEVNKNNWKPFIAILADCMQNARFDKEHLASEVMAVIQELRMCEDKYWRVMLEEASNSQYPVNHPYHFPIIGYKEDLLGITPEKVQEFYKKHYVPGRSTLFVVGDVDPKEVIEEVKKHFGAIPAAPVPKVVIPPAFQTFSTHNTTLYREVSHPKLGFSFKIGGLSSHDATCIKALEFILGHGEGSRLYKRLVDIEMVATSVSVFGYMLREGGTFLILVEPKNGSLESCKKFILEELENLIKHGPSKSELSRLALTKKREFFEMLERFEEFTHEWIDSYFATQDEYAIFDDVEKMCRLQAKDIQECAKKYLDPFFMNQIQMLPIPKDKKDAWLEAKAYQENLEKQILERYVRTAPLETPEFVHTLPKPEHLKFSFPKPTHTFTLKNGLNVLLHKDSFRPIVSVSLRQRASDFYAEALEGVSLSILMEMLMEGSKGHSKDDNVNFFESRGIAYSFSTSGVCLDMPQEELATALKRLKYIIEHPSFPDDAFEKVKENALDSYERALDESVPVAFRLLKKNLYKDHPYGWLFEDALAVIKKLSIADLKILHKDLIAPQNFILSISGDFDDHDVEKQIHSIFGSWKESDYVVKPTKHDRAVATQEHVDKQMLRDQTVLLLGSQSPITIDNPDRIPLNILNYISWYSLGSRLYQLREQTGLFYTASGSWASGVSKEAGYNYIYSILTPETLESSEKAFRGVIDEIAHNGVTQDELDMAKQLYCKQLIDISSGNSTIARQIAGLQALGLGFDYYDKVLDRVQNMTVSEVNAIAKKYFTSTNMSRVRVGRLKTTNASAS